MKESGEIEYNDRRSISTAQTEMESPSRYMKILGYVACGNGLNCSPLSACDEFEYVKHQYHKEDSRQYYHIVQSFSPDDNITPELAYEIGMKFAENATIEKILGRKITNEAYLTYCTREDYEQQAEIRQG